MFLAVGYNLHSDETISMDCGSKKNMSEKNHSNHTDLMWQMHMQTLMKRKRSMETAQIIDEAINEWYSSQGQSVPKWKLKKDPQWWIDYLTELNIDPRNP
jgi:hypothetical protein